MTRLDGGRGCPCRVCKRMCAMHYDEGLSNGDNVVITWSPGTCYERRPRAEDRGVEVVNVKNASFIRAIADI